MTPLQHSLDHGDSRLKTLGGLLTMLRGKHRAHVEPCPQPPGGCCLPVSPAAPPVPSPHPPAPPTPLGIALQLLWDLCPLHSGLGRGPRAAPPSPFLKGPFPAHQCLEPVPLRGCFSGEDACDLLVAVTSTVHRQLPCTEPQRTAGQQAVLRTRENTFGHPAHSGG